MLATRLRQQDRLDEALAQARKAEKAAPDFAPAVVQAAELAQQLQRRRLALQLLENSWRTRPHPDVARAYAQLDPNEAPEKRLQRVDTRLAPLAKSDPETLVLQAELAMQAGQWDTARMRLDAAGDGARVCRLRAELERQTQGDQAKVQEWLAKASEGAPDRAWVCEDTGEVLPAWQPFAPSGRFDAVQWSEPPRLATLLSSSETTYILPRGGDVAPQPQAAAA
jgi:HemY protein